MKIDNLCRVLREFRDNGPMTRQDAAALLEVSEDTVWHWFAKLNAWGLIRPCGTTGRQQKFELAPAAHPLGTPYIRRGQRECAESIGAKRLDETPSA